MTLEEAQAALALWKWREAQLIEISEQVENAFPSLEDRIREAIAERGIAKAAIISLGFRNKLQELIDQWATEQTQIAMMRAEAELDETIAEIEDHLDLGSDLKHTLASAAPMLVGTGLLAGALAAVPVAIAFGVQTTTVLFVLSTSTVSIPVIAAGAIGAGLLATSGVAVLGRSTASVKVRLERKCLSAARQKVFGKTGNPEEKCILNSIQAMVLRAGETRLKEIG